MATCIFHPQVRDDNLDGVYYEVETDQVREWEHPGLRAGILTDSLYSDQLRVSRYAPEWVKNWTGPYFVEVRYAEGENAPTIDPYVNDPVPYPLTGVLLWLVSVVSGLVAVTHFWRFN